MSGLDCESTVWKVGFVRGKSGTINVREQPSTTSRIVTSVSVADRNRKFVEWSVTAASGPWYPVRVHAEKIGMLTGWIHSDFATFSEVQLCQPQITVNPGDTSRFIDLPLPGYPTMALNGAERETLGGLLRWLSWYILSGPYQFPQDGEINLEQLQAAVQQLEATIRLAQVLPPHES